MIATPSVTEIARSWRFHHGRALLFGEHHVERVRQRRGAARRAPERSPRCRSPRSRRRPVSMNAWTRVAIIWPHARRHRARQHRDALLDRVGVDDQHRERQHEHQHREQREDRVVRHHRADVVDVVLEQLLARAGRGSAQMCARSRSRPDVRGRAACAEEVSPGCAERWAKRLEDRLIPRNVGAHAIERSRRRATTSAPGRIRNPRPRLEGGCSDPPELWARGRHHRARRSGRARFPEAGAEAHCAARSCRFRAMQRIAISVAIVFGGGFVLGACSKGEDAGREAAKAEAEAEGQGQGARAGEGPAPAGAGRDEDPLQPDHRRGRVPAGARGEGAAHGEVQRAIRTRPRRAV